MPANKREHAARDESSLVRIYKHYRITTRLVEQETDAARRSALRKYRDGVPFAARRAPGRRLYA